MKKAAVHRRSGSDTPWDAPLVPCNCGCENEECQVERESSESTHLNDPVSSPEVADKGETNSVQKNNTFAMVLHKDGTRLMPTRIGNAKDLVRKGRATIVDCKPLVIQLTYETTKRKQDLTLGIDSGFVHVGYSVVSQELNREYICGELEMEHSASDQNPTKTRLTERAMYRRNRRNRLWHRESRFLNRGIKEGWLAPSISRKCETHMRLCKKLCKYLPITSVRFEVGNFDIQKIEDSEISGVGYQQGDMYGHQNVKEYLFAREHGTCQLCGKVVVGQRINIHHIITRSKGGTDRPSNLALLHEECHKRLHREHLEKKLKKNRRYKGETFMNIFAVWLRKNFPEIEITYGYETRCKRYEDGIEKSHANDAFVIAGGDKTFTRSAQFDLAQTRRNDRQLQWNNIKRKNSGGRRIRKQRKPYHKGDMAFVDGKWIECQGMSNDRVVIGFKKTVNGNNSAITVNQKKIEKVYRRSGVFFK